MVEYVNPAEHDDPERAARFIAAVLAESTSHDQGRGGCVCALCRIVREHLSPVMGVRSLEHTPGRDVEVEAAQVREGDWLMDLHRGYAVGVIARVEPVGARMVRWRYVDGSVSSPMLSVAPVVVRRPEVVGS